MRERTTCTQLKKENKQSLPRPSFRPLVRLDLFHSTVCVNTVHAGKVVREYLPVDHVKIEFVAVNVGERSGTLL
ncbi:MAG: hypothetical protein ACOC87_00955, partial [Candidatus Natronoplasma sp.]